MLWKGRAFHRVLCGSVIEFIRLREFRLIFLQSLDQLAERKDMLVKVSKTLKQLEENEQRITKQLSIIKELKVSVAAQLFPRDCYR
jgi:hypothetical protein